MDASQMAHCMQQLSRNSPGGGLEMCLAGGQGCFGGGEAAYKLNVSLGFNKLWYLPADRYPEARNSLTDRHLGVGWSCDEEGGWRA